MRAPAPGHEVTAVVERPDLRGLGDLELSVAASAERRALVTEVARGSVPLGARRLPGGVAHHGIVLMSPAAFPWSRAAVGHAVRALVSLLAEHPADEEPVGQFVWLPQATDAPGRTDTAAAG